MSSSISGTEIAHAEGQANPLTNVMAVMEHAQDALQASALRVQSPAG